MTAMETLLANPFEKTFTEFVDDEKITQIKGTLFEQYHMTLTSSLKDFEKFELIAEQILDDGISIIKKTFDHICHLESKSKNIINIKDKSLKNIILQSYNDPLKKQILDIAFDYPLTIWEIAARSKIGALYLSGDISYLISHGLLATNDLDDSEHNKKYYSTIDEISVKIQEEEFHMCVTINEIANENPMKIIS